MGCVPVVIFTSDCGNCAGSTSCGNTISYANSPTGWLSIATCSVGALVRRIVVKSNTLDGKLPRPGPSSLRIRLDPYGYGSLLVEFTDGSSKKLKNNLLFIQYILLNPPGSV